MNGLIYIDGVDIFSEYGVFVANGGLRELIALPPFKKVDVVEWPEYDGEEVDLTAPVFDTRKFNIKLATRNYSRFDDFVDMLIDGAYHDFEFEDIGKTYRLRLVSNPNLSSLRQLGVFDLSFADDFPMDLSDASFEPNGDNLVRVQDMRIDNINLAQYGVQVIQGTKESLNKRADIRQNWTVSSTFVGGVIYDGEEVRSRARDAVIKLFIRTNTLAEFWERYYGLFKAVCASGMRVISFLGMDYHCYYRKCSVPEFEVIRGGVWCKIDLTMRISTTNETEWMLSTEDGIAIRSEEEDDIIVIRLSKTA